MNRTAKKSSMPILPDSVVTEVLSYFHFFSYAPTEEDIYTYLPIKVTKKTLSARLHEMTMQGVIEKKELSEMKHGGNHIYAIRGKGIFLAHHEKKREISYRKIQRMATLIHVLQSVPAIRLIGLSGSCTMGNARKDDDVDFFIIASPGRIWTARFACIAVAFLLGHKRHRGVHKAPDKACFNMFFDLNDVLVSHNKQNLYTGHEVLQMSPVSMLPIKNIHEKLSKSYTRREKAAYQAFLWSNEWVHRYFPNAVNRTKEFGGAGGGISKKAAGKSIVANVAEEILKAIQKSIMARHKTKEIITDTQLWFFPRDFQSKLKQFIPKSGPQSQR